MQAQKAPPKHRRVVDYLTDLASEEGVCFIKSKDLTEDLELSTKEVGSVLSDLSSKQDSTVQVEKWSYTNATTWRVERS